MSQEKIVDVVVIGGGPGGYHAAMHAHAKGLQTALVERGDLGGVCLNQGCIPTKTLLSVAKFYSKVKKAGDFGINITGEFLNETTLFNHKEMVVSGLRKGMGAQANRAGIVLIKGNARLLDGLRVEVTGGDGNQVVSAKSIVIATGSRPKAFPKIPFDGSIFLSSDDILNLNHIPKSLAIIGGGAIGVEFASMFHAFGTKITIVEMLERLLPLEDSDIGKRLEVSLKRRGVAVHTADQVASIAKTNSGASIVLKSGEKIQAERVLVSIGRERNIENLGLDAAGVTCDNGAIEVDEYLETKTKNIYAIGDVTDLPQLAHVSSFGGILVIDNLCNPNDRR